MNATATSSTRDLVEVTRHIAAATTALTHLATTLSARQSGTPQPAATHPRVAHPKAASKRVAKKQAAQTPGAGRIPAALMKKINRIQRKKANPPLSEESKRAIKMLLETPSISVASIAALYHRSPAHLYQLCKRWNVKARKASPALMAGIKRAKQKAKSPAAPKVEAPAPVAPAAQTPVPEAAPQAPRPIAVEV